MSAYEMRISDWSSDVCSSDLEEVQLRGEAKARQVLLRIYKINIGKAQAPSSDQIPARNTPIHQPTPYDGANCPLLRFPSSIPNATFPKRSPTWPKSQLGADWAWWVKPR